VTVIAERRERSWPAVENKNGLHVRRLWCLYQPHLHLVTALTAFTLFLLTQGRHFQLWHIHQYGLHAVLAVVVGKLLKRPVVLKLTSSTSEGIQGVISSLPLKRFTRLLLLKVDAVIALTREMQVEAEMFGFPTSRVHILGNGVDTQRFRLRSDEERMRLRKKLGVEATGMVLFVGRLAPEKNPDGLIKAWRMALPRLPVGWKLVLVGGGPMQTELGSFVISAWLSDSVYIAGHQGNVEKWMAAADIYALTSHREGLSNTTLEAMASGLPVVSTRVSGSSETLSETGAGLVVNVGRMDQVADALVHLAADTGMRYRMGQRGREVIESKYSISRVAERHENLYRILLAG
jgi:glycosyltransferase involved in cell wall biosynthesis